MSAELRYVTLDFVSHFTFTNYSLLDRGVFTAVGIIYREEGIRGFFCGLLPRLLCDLTALWLGKTLAHIINNYLVEDPDLKRYVTGSMNVSS